MRGNTMIRHSNAGRTIVPPQSCKVTSGKSVEQLKLCAALRSNGRLDKTPQQIDKNDRQRTTNLEEDTP